MIQRVFTVVIGKPFLRGLLLPYFLFLFLLSAADANTNWEAARRQVAMMPAAARTVLLVGMIAGWCFAAGRALRPVWRDKTIPFLVRQPIGPWALSARLLPSLSVALIPVALIWWLASYGANPVAHYFGFVGLALPIILGASFSGITSACIVGISVAALALLVWVYSYWGGAAYLGMLATPLLFRGVTAFIRSTMTVQSNAAHREMSSASVIRVLVRRDWRSIVRSRQQTLVELVAVHYRLRVGVGERRSPPHPRAPTHLFRFSDP